MSAWATPEQARQDWPDAPTSDPVLARLLDDATAQCQAYAPALAEDAEGPPSAWQRACVLQARELWAAARRDAATSMGVTDAYPVPALPLTAAVRGLLRPRRAVPRVH